MTKIFKRTNSSDLDFIELIKELDFYLALKDGEEHSYYAQFNKISELPHCIVMYEDDVHVGSGAIKQYDRETAEVKRMFVKPDYRGKGCLLDTSRCVEETGSIPGFSKVGISG